VLTSHLLVPFPHPSGINVLCFSFKSQIYRQIYSAQKTQGLAFYTDQKSIEINRNQWKSIEISAQYVHYALHLANRCRLRTAVSINGRSIHRAKLSATVALLCFSSTWLNSASFSGFQLVLKSGKIRANTFNTS
jgi:hypothetical protein